MLDPSTTGHTATARTRPGRPAEPMEVLRGTLHEATAGTAGALLVRGEAGIGRSTFLAEAALLATRFGFLTARGRCHPLARQEADSTARQLCEDLGRDAGDAPADPTAPPVSGLYRSVVAAQSTRPVLLAVDDLQWCDAWSLRAVSHLLHRRTGLRVVLLASIRGDLPVSHPEPCQDVLTALRALHLPGLDRAGVEQLTRAVLRGTPDPRFVAECLRRTGGNPRLLLAVLAELAEHGVAPDLSGVGLLTRYAPQTAARYVLARAGGPDSDAWRLAAALAVLGGRATLERVALVAQLAPDSAARAADLLFQAELLATGRPLAFTHPVLGDAVARHLPAGTAAHLHSRAAAGPAPAQPASPRGWTEPATLAGPPAAHPPADRRRPSTGAVELRCLGGFRMVVGGSEVDCSGARPKVGRLLRLLALHAGTAVHRELLLDALWPDLPLEAGIRNLQVTVSRLRVLLGPGLLVRTGASYGLGLDGRVRSDVREFERAAEAARPRGRALGPDRGLARLRTARGWYRGDLLPEEGPADWVVEERARLRARAAEVSAALAEAELAVGRTSAAVEAAEDSLRLEPFHDGAWRTLIAAYRGAGDLASFERASRRYDSLLSSLACADRG